MKTSRYNQYYNDMHEVGNHIILRRVSKSPRRGIRKIIDIGTFYKSAWQSAETWSGLPKAIVYWLALTPLAITSFNGFMEILGMNVEIPLAMGSALAVIFVVFLMAFGIISWTHMGLNRRTSEINALHNSSQYLLYVQHEEIKEQNENMVAVLKEIREKL